MLSNRPDKEATANIRTRFETAKQAQLNLINLGILPGFGLTDLDELLDPIAYTIRSDPSFPPTNLITETISFSSGTLTSLPSLLSLGTSPADQARTNRMKGVDIPLFSGDDFAKWLKQLEIAMILLEFFGNKEMMAALFSRHLVEGSQAEVWFNSLPDTVDTTDWAKLLPHIKLRFGAPAVDTKVASAEVMAAKLADKDVGEVDGDGVAKHKAWSRYIALRTRVIGENSTLTLIVVDNLGKHMQSLLSSTDQDTVAAICKKVEGLTPSEISLIKKKVAKDEDDKKMKAEFEEFRRFTQNGGSQYGNGNRYGGRSLENVQPFVPAAANTTLCYVPAARQQAQQPDQSITVPLGPFDNTPQGHAAYKAAVSCFYAKYGNDAISSSLRPFPCTPGTDAPGRNECFRCGEADHQRVQCVANYTIPENEGRYRAAVMREARGRLTGSNAQPMGRPMRYMDIDTETGHLAALHMMPSQSGNGQGLHQAR